MLPLCVLPLSVSEPRTGSASQSLGVWTLTADNLGAPTLTTLGGNFLWQGYKSASVGGLAAPADLLGTYHRWGGTASRWFSQAAPDVPTAHVWKVLESWTLLWGGMPYRARESGQGGGQGPGKEANAVGVGLLEGRARSRLTQPQDTPPPWLSSINCFGSGLCSGEKYTALDVTGKPK